MYVLWNVSVQPDRYVYIYTNKPNLLENFNLSRSFFLYFFYKIYGFLQWSIIKCCVYYFHQLLLICWDGFIFKSICILLFVLAWFSLYGSGGVTFGDKRLKALLFRHSHFHFQLLYFSKKWNLPTKTWNTFFLRTFFFTEFVYYESIVTERKVTEKLGWTIFSKFSLSAKSFVELNLISS